MPRGGEFASTHMAGLSCRQDSPRLLDFRSAKLLALGKLPAGVSAPAANTRIATSRCGLSGWRLSALLNSSSNLEPNDGPSPEEFPKALELIVGALARQHPISPKQKPQ
jgi:hypothetical protein